ncbi:MAG: hypothetical protein HY858_13365 [Candidatus Solibacter usitatus]|nr:hypothetical protein [Candidatus Solibacter usitatus]
MRRARRVSIALLMVMAAGARAEVIDRVAAAAGQQVVTLSAIRRALRLQAVFDLREYEDTPAERRKAADRLIDQAIVLREIGLSRYAGATMAEADALLGGFGKDRGMTGEQLAAALERYGFSEDDFRQEMLWRVTVQRFVDFRFMPGVQVSDGEVQAYYEQEFVPALRAADGKAVAPAVEEVRERITQVLTTRKTNAALEQWLKQARETLKVRFFEEAFR